MKPEDILNKYTNKPPQESVVKNVAGSLASSAKTFASESLGGIKYLEPSDIKTVAKESTKNLGSLGGYLVKDLPRDILGGLSMVGKTVLRGVYGKDLYEKLDNPSEKDIEIEKMLFRGQTKPYQEVKEEIDKFVTQANGTDFEKKYLGTIIATAGFTLDAMPGKPGKEPLKTVITEVSEKLAKETSEEAVEQVVRQYIKGADGDIKRLSQLISIEKDPTAVRIALENSITPNNLKKVANQVDQPLIQEAKRYKSAEEFVKAQGKPVYHGTPVKDSFETGVLTPKSSKSLIEKEGVKPSEKGTYGSGVYMTRTEAGARGFVQGMKGTKVDTVELFIEPNAKIYKFDPFAIYKNQDKIHRGIVDNKKNAKDILTKAGYDGLEIAGREIVIFNPSQIKTKSQLTDIWKQAQAKVSSAEALRVAKAEAGAFPYKPVKTLVRETTQQTKDIEYRKLVQRLKRDETVARVAKLAGKRAEALRVDNLKEEREFFASLKNEIGKAIQKESSKQKNAIKKQIGYQQFTKNLPSSVKVALKDKHGVSSWNKATREQLTAILNDMEKLQKGDSFLTANQIRGLKDYLELGFKGRNPKTVTKREVQTMFKEETEIMKGAVTSRISNRFFPTVDIKEGHPVIKKIVDDAFEYTRKANAQIKKVNEDLDTLLVKMEKNLPRSAFGSKKQTKYEAWNNIFKHLSGETVPLTKDQLDVADYMKQYFADAKEALKLERYRKNYITHTQKEWMESFRTKGFSGTIQEMLQRNNGELPVDTLLAIDEIIGSEKFFRFGLKRSGKIDPSKDLRKIFFEYSNLVETKKALDKFLPEAQASQQLLLQGKSALWMKEYLQNLKGRALDFKFRNGKMGWLAKVADRGIDIGYVQLLALNLFSGVKNIVGGEVNSFVLQPVTKYLLGKKRLLASPYKSYKVISSSGLLDGSYVDVVRHGFWGKGGKAKKALDKVLYGAMEGAEYEIRGSLLLGEMTKQEWKDGVVSPKRFREIMDKISITQGVYSKIDSPLFTQTVVGRSTVQFGRWKITNALLARRILKGAKKELAQGNYTGKNTRSIMKMLVISGLGMYYANEFAKVGNKKAQQMAETSAELVKTIFDTLTGETIYEAIRNNPLLSNVGSLVFSMQQLASYISGGLIEEPSQVEFRKGIQDSYVAGLKTLGFYKEKEKTQADKILEKYRNDSKGKTPEDILKKYQR